VVVVDDASNTEQLSAVQEIVSQKGDNFTLVTRSILERSHGPNAARNTGAEVSNGQYFAFLDDDDYWCDPDYLYAAHQAITQKKNVDFFIADQQAIRGEVVVVDEWLPHLNRLAKSDNRGLSFSDVRARDILQAEGVGFPHVNSSIVKKELFDEIEGFWEGSPYEGDLNFFLRLLSRSKSAVYWPRVASINVLREDALHGGVNSISAESKMLYRILVCEHARLNSTGWPRKYARILQAGVLKTLAKNRYSISRDWESAGDLALQATSLDISIRWMLISIYFKIRTYVHQLLSK